MDVLVLLLLIAAAVCFVLAALRVTMRWELVATGLLLWVLTELIPAIASL